MAVLFSENLPLKFNDTHPMQTTQLIYYTPLINGVDYFNILDGPSNGMELLTFFDEAHQLEREDGSATLERGDCVIMDNCGFHHARFVEPILRNILADCGITLLFQPPYSPDFNTCEFCFRQIKDYLRRYQLLAEHETKIAIALSQDIPNAKATRKP